MQFQLEVRNYHNKLQPVFRGHVCTDFICNNIKLCLMSLFLAWHSLFHLDQFLMFENSIQ